MPKSKVIVNRLTLERDAGEFIGTKGNMTDAISKYAKKYKKSKISFKPKNGESLFGVYKRAKKFIQYLRNNFKDKSILICGHKAFLLCLEIVLRNKNIKNYYSFKEPNTGEIRKFNL